jgi:transcription-repair coupling factor (superfamily II helicase)
LKLYRRLAEIKDEEGIEEITAELIDRFGQLPKQVESLLFLIRVKLLAYRAGVETVASEEGQITLRSRLWESDESHAPVIAALGAATRMSKGKAWLPRAADEARTNWREQLVGALEALGKVFAEG